jgi:hypothetical protein
LRITIIKASYDFKVGGTFFAFLSGMPFRLVLPLLVATLLVGRSANARGAEHPLRRSPGAESEIRFVSGGRFGRGQRLGAAGRNGNNGGAYEAVVRQGGRRRSVVEKRLTPVADTPAARRVLNMLVELNQVAADKGLAPTFLGYRDVTRRGKIVRLLYAERFGADGRTISDDQGRPLVGSGTGWIDPFLGLLGRSATRLSAPESLPSLDTVTRHGISRSTPVGGMALVRLLRRHHPDHRNEENILWRISRVGGAPRVEVVGVDWDHPDYLEHADSAYLVSELQAKIDRLRALRLTERPRAEILGRLHQRTTAVRQRLEQRGRDQPRVQLELRAELNQLWDYKAALSESP